MGLKAQGLRAYEAINDEGQPLCIIPRNAEDDGLGLTVFTQYGKITGVAVYDAEQDYKTLAAVGDVPASHLDKRYDSLTGEEIEEAGWTVLRPIDGVAWEFSSLTGILNALAEGTFGLKIRTPADDELLAQQYEVAWHAGYLAATEDVYNLQAQANTPEQPAEKCCPQETCDSCPDEDTCDNLRRAEYINEAHHIPNEDLVMTWKVNAREEPLGWDAPELRF